MQGRRASTRHAGWRALGLAAALLVGAARGSASPLSAEVVMGRLGASNTVARVGREGWFCVRSRARLDELLTRFKECGWEARGGAPFAALDFSRELVLGYLREGEDGDRFECRRRGGDAARAEVELLRRFVAREPGTAAEKHGAFILVAVPRSSEVAVRLSRLREGAEASAEPVQEVGRTLVPGAGDVVDGLRVAVRAEKDRVQAGEDIRIEFRLEWENPWVGRELSAVPARSPIHVWDATYSKGYRNHALLVETPDGRNLVLQRPEVGEWLKNAPHPQAVAEGEPCILHGGDGRPGLSLQALGLRTDQPGDYRITGLYRAAAEETAWQGRTLRLWGGSVAGNTVVVRVLPAGG